MFIPSRRAAIVNTSIDRTHPGNAGDRSGIATSKVEGESDRCEAELSFEEMMVAREGMNGVRALLLSLRPSRRWVVVEI